MSGDRASFLDQLPRPKFLRKIIREAKSPPPNANASIPSSTSADFAAGMADGGSCHADTINSHPTGAASCSNLCDDDAIRLMRWHERHGVRRCCDDQGKGDSDQPDHFRLSTLLLSSSAIDPFFAQVSDH
jgi:hypothetical protein